MANRGARATGRQHYKASAPETGSPIARKGNRAGIMAFTIHASKNGERVEAHRISPLIVVAKARELLKAGWLVHITDAGGRQYAPSEFDRLLSLDRRS